MSTSRITPQPRLRHAVVIDARCLPPVRCLSVAGYSPSLYAAEITAAPGRHPAGTLYGRAMRAATMP
jgi:hypothetical protein